MSGPTLDDRILQATRRALRRFGYQGATLERIAREAGMSRVTLHRHGVTKQLLLAELTRRATEDYRAALWPALTAPGTARERLEAALIALCKAADDNLELIVALRAQTDAIFHETDEQPLTRTVFTEPLERLLRDGAADGSLRHVDPVETATTLFNLVGWTYIHLRTGHDWPPERARDATLDIALNGLTDQAPGDLDSGARPLGRAARLPT